MSKFHWTKASRFSNHADMSQPLLRELFGPSREEIWRQLAREMNASYVAGDFWWKRDKVQASRAGWLITLDEHGKYHHTRMRAPFLNPGGFRFTVYRKGIFTEPGKYLHMVPRCFRCNDNRACLVRGPNQGMRQVREASWRLSVF